MALNYILSTEAAQDQFELFTDYYELELSGDMAESARDAIIKAVRLGRVTIAEADGKLSVTQVFKNPPGDVSEIEWVEISGKHKMAMDGCKDTEVYARAYRLAGALTGMGEAGIKNLRGPDLSVAESLGVLFLLV